MTGEAPFFDDLAEAPAGGSVFWVDAGCARVRAAVCPGGARGAVFLCSGRTEYIEKYGRVIGELTARGFSVVTCDWRGQGLSDRALADPMKGHVGDFAEYQRDVEAVLASPEAAAVGPPRVMIWPPSPVPNWCSLMRWELAPIPPRARRWPSPCSSS